MTTILQVEDEKSKVAKSKATKADPSPVDKSKVMEEAKRELPYTFAVPEDYDGLAGLFSGRSPAQQG